MNRSIVLAGHALCVLAACGHPARPAGSPDRASPPPPEPKSESESESESESDERGMKVESAPLDLQIALYMRGSRNGPLKTGDTIVSGDRIQVTVQTSEDAHLYLAYCDNASKLSVFPPQGSIRTAARQITYAPSKAAELVVDNNVGSERLYVILSREELSSADPRLTAAIQASTPGGAPPSCGEQLRAAMTAPPRSRHPSRVTQPAPARQAPPAHADTGRATEKAASPPPTWSPPPVTTERIVERGMFISSNGAEMTAATDASGIAILRYELVHVAPATSATAPPSP